MGEHRQTTANIMFIEYQLATMLQRAIKHGRGLDSDMRVVDSSLNENGFPRLMYLDARVLAGETVLEMIRQCGLVGGRCVTEGRL